MRPRLIQTTKIGKDNRAEKVMLEFLSELPENYTIYRELKVNRDYADRMRGYEKGQPDFVVVSSEIGLLSVEVKDWNIVSNRYVWTDQYKVTRESLATGEKITLTNPAAQADAYLHAFRELLRSTGVYITSIVAFPRISRNAFLNQVGNLDVLKNQQTKFFLDFDKVIFSEDIDEFELNPQDLLRRIVRRSGSNQTYSERTIHEVNRTILPNSFRLGDISDRQRKLEKLKMITADQEKWIFNLERSCSYLLDVAGSGKTNALVSKAIFIIDQAHKQRRQPPNILLTTYNPHLQRNIENTLNGKIKPEERHNEYRSLRIENIEYIMKRIATSGYGLSKNHEYYQMNSPANADFYAMLRDDVRAALEDNPEKFCVFDYIFIDEIQDFDDEQLNVIRKLARQENFFFVGDIGQKIYDRYHDLRRHGFVIDELELPKTYKMYRTPRYIGELAYRFVMDDSIIRKEFEQNGYRRETQFESYLENAAELYRVKDSISATVERIQDLLTRYSLGDIMVITSHRLGQKLDTALKSSDINYCIGEPKQSEQLSIIDFMNVKGLEREVVIIIGIEDLPDRTKSSRLFDDPASQLKEDRFSRRKIYVALTRAIEECIVFYTDPSNAFVSELVTLNRKITSKRQRT